MKCKDDKNIRKTKKTENNLLSIDSKSKKIKKIKKLKKQKLLEMQESTVDISSKIIQDSNKSVKKTSINSIEFNEIEEKIVITKKKNRKRKKKHLPRHGNYKSIKNKDIQSIDSGYIDSSKSEEIIKISDNSLKNRTFKSDFNCSAISKPVENKSTTPVMIINKQVPYIKESQHMKITNIHSDFPIVNEVFLNIFVCTILFFT